MIKKISIIFSIVLFTALLHQITDANACNYECAIVCNDISGSCLGANPYSMNENPWGYAEHVNICRNIYDLCMDQAFPQVA